MSKDNIIVAVIGLCGAGKSEATQVFLDNDFKRVYFGDVTFDEMKTRLVTATCQYARRQRTWFRHQHPEAEIISPGSPLPIAD